MHFRTNLVFVLELLLPECCLCLDDDEDDDDRDDDRW